MRSIDKKLDRLFRAAARVAESAPTAPPFGFETRVVALWRSGGTKQNGLTALLRHVALLSLTVTVVATIGALWELKQSREMGESFSNEFAIADSAIQSEFGK
jgi:hypothetical protein